MMCVLPLHDAHSREPCKQPSVNWLYFLFSDAYVRRHRRRRRRFRCPFGNHIHTHTQTPTIQINTIHTQKTTSIQTFARSSWMSTRVRESADMTLARANICTGKSTHAAALDGRIDGGSIAKRNFTCIVWQICKRLRLILPPFCVKKHYLYIVDNTT